MNLLDLNKPYNFLLWIGVRTLETIESYTKQAQKTRITNLRAKQKQLEQELMSLYEETGDEWPELEDYRDW